MGGKTVSSLIYYIVVLVKKDRLCVAKVILAISGTPYIFGRGRKGAGLENHDNASGSQPFGRSGRGGLAGTESSVASCC